MSKKSICFIHYGIGWKDGINTVIKSFASQIQKKDPCFKICLLGGEIGSRFLKDAEYKKIPALLPKGKKLSKTSFEKQALNIAKKISKATEGIKTVVIENPLMGLYHLPAMLGFSIYANQYKPKGVKVFFRVHDLYTDNPQYFKGIDNYLSSKELKDIFQGKGVDGFLIINHVLKERLIKQGTPEKKIFYLPNGVDKTIFSQKISDQESEIIRKKLNVSDKAKILLYPVRVVPRKNIEEAILLTHFIRQLTEDEYILVISGKIDKYDPLSKLYYRQLKELADLVNFSVIFTKKPYPLEREYNKKGKISQFSIGDIYQISEAVLMTSLREGFGYPFLESWFANKIVIGRRIENVISDFEKSGLDFHWLYNGLPIKAEAGNQEGVQRVESFLKIFENNDLEKQVLELNKDRIMDQIEVLQDKEQQKQIIEDNLMKASQIYEISEATDRFLELVGFCRHNHQRIDK